MTLFTPLRWSLASLLLFSAFSHSKTITHSAIEPFSLLRVGDRLNMMLDLTYDDGQKIQRWQSVDCKNHTLSALYWDRLNAEQHTDTRFYGSSYLRYAPPQPQPDIPAVMIEKLCALNSKAPRWEKLESDEAGTVTLLDTQSIQRIKNGLIARIGYDFAEIIHEPPYDAPLTLKVENYAYNCETHLSAALSALNISSAGDVTDSLIGADIDRRKASFPLTPLLRSTFDTLCSLSDVATFHAQGHFTPRSNKSQSKTLGSMLPDMKNNPAEWINSKPVSAAIDSAAQALINPWARPAFRQIRWEEKSHQGTVKVRIDVDPRGYARKLEEYGIWQVQRLTVGNIIQLKYGMSISYTPSVLTLLDSNLTMPLFKGQRYSIRTLMPISSDSKDDRTKLETCEVTGEGQAKLLSPAFSGHYWQVDCQVESEGQPKLVTRSAWLRDLRLMVPVTQTLGDKAESPVKLENVTIER